MDDISEQEAVHKAKEALDFPETSAYRVWRVHSLDREADDYYLVQLDTEKGKSAVAMVDIRSGAVNISAQLPYSEAHLTVDALIAKKLAGADQRSQADLVWMPSQVSRSPLYPFWKITMSNGVVRYVNQQKNVLYNIQTSRLGG